MKLNKILLPLLFTTCVSSAATDIANVPMSAATPAKPNLVILLDDSGSMDFDVLLRTNNGELWWDNTTHTFFDVNGNFHFNKTGDVGKQSDGDWIEYEYLFPNGTSLDRTTVPPIPAFGFIRSSDYNPLYYNPKITYQPWQPAYINNQTVTFANPDPKAARTHPVLTDTPVTMNLTQTYIPNNSNFSFRMYGSMIIPGNTISGITARKVGSTIWASITTAFTIPNGTVYDVAIPFYPATYFLKDDTCAFGPDCVTAPDGKRLRRYEIKSGKQFPSGRSYADEMQNFANWFTYYRKRKLMMGGAAGQTLTNIRNVRGGITLLNNRNTWTMYDFDSSSPANNYQAVLGIIYTTNRGGSTPTRDALNYVGNQFTANKNIIQYACQTNSTMVLTDGFAQATTPAIPSYNKNAWGSTVPYQTTYTSSLADIALAYYTINPRPDLPQGLVPTITSGSNPDQNPNLHMDTYALTLGPLGTIYGTSTPQALDPFTNPPTWPIPNVDKSPTAVDDLWHATINGRGQMLNADDSESTVMALIRIISEIILKGGAASSIGLSDIFFESADNIAYVNSYNINYGDLIAYTITQSGIDLANKLWSAKEKLELQNANARLIATYNGTSGIPFRWINLTNAMQNNLKQSLMGSNSLSDATAQLLLNWLRGDRSNEGLLFRKRMFILGDIVHAEPVNISGATANYADPTYAIFSNAIKNRALMIYQGANDGMLHAFDGATGQEKWAYVPSLFFNNINQLASNGYTHKFFVDATPAVSDIYLNNQWSTLLVGGLRAGGSGYYAIDVTNPSGVTSENSLASSVKWEFPNNFTPTAVKNNIGLSFGKPLIVKTQAAGWVVIVSSGYNTNGDGKGHLFILNPSNGTLIKELVTTSGNSTNEAGLAKLAAFASNSEFDPLIDYVYGGDLLGNVWRFDLSGASINNWNVKLLAQLTDANGKSQPVTSEPELSMVKNNRVVFVGTGKLLGASDLSDTSTQTMYAIVDDKSATPTVAPLRQKLVQRQVVGNLVTGNSLDFTVHKGWYIDLPVAGERIDTDPLIAFGAIIFNTNHPTVSNCEAESFQYLLDITTGMTRAASTFGTTTPWARKLLAKTLTSAPKIMVMQNNQQLASLSHTANNSVIELPIPNLSPNVFSAVAWKEVLNEG